MNFKNYLLALLLITPACFAFDASDLTVRRYNQATDERNLEKEIHRFLAAIDFNTQPSWRAEDSDEERVKAILKQWNDPTDKNVQFFTLTSKTSGNNIGFVCIASGFLIPFMSDAHIYLQNTVLEELYVLALNS